MVIPLGDLKKPLSFPKVPHFETKFPSRSNFWTLWFLLSTTNTNSPDTAIPIGWPNSPSLVPRVPHSSRNSPEESNFWTREFPRSVT